jgi:hypothetical protein
MENAQRDLRRVLNCALVIVIIAFTSMNTALYLILSIIVIRKEYTPVVVSPGKSLPVPSPMVDIPYRNLGDIYLASEAAYCIP